MLAERAGFSVKETAVALDVNEKTVRKGIAAGDIPAFDVAGRKIVAGWWLKQKLTGPVKAS